MSTEEEYERAKDRNEGKEPDELHLAYEREMSRLRVENDIALEVVARWTAGTARASGIRQDELARWWPALAEGLNALRDVMWRVS